MKFLFATTFLLLNLKANLTLGQTGNASEYATISITEVFNYGDRNREIVITNNPQILKDFENSKIANRLFKNVHLWDYFLLDELGHFLSGDTLNQLNINAKEITVRNWLAISLKSKSEEKIFYYDAIKFQTSCSSFLEICQNKKEVNKVFFRYLNE